MSAFQSTISDMASLKLIHLRSTSARQAVPRLATARPVLRDRGTPSVREGERGSGFAGWIRNSQGLVKSMLLSFGFRPPKFQLKPR
jgi:hypothetical protein